MAATRARRIRVAGFCTGTLAAVLLTGTGAAAAGAAETSSADVCRQAIVQAGTGLGTYGHYRLVEAPAVGGSGPDVVVGSSGPDRLSGGSGNDVLCGLGGDDVLDGGSGSDYLDGGAGVDQLFGGTGSDTLVGGAGDDGATGGSGSDSCSAEVSTCEQPHPVLGGAEALIQFASTGTYECQTATGTDTCWGSITADGLQPNELVQVVSRSENPTVVASLSADASGEIADGTAANIVCTGALNPFVAFSRTAPETPNVFAPC